eukprot:366175-Chlamydomonas_euryale.AAC.16
MKQGLDRRAVPQAQMAGREEFCKTAAIKVQAALCVTKVIGCVSCHESQQAATGVFIACAKSPGCADVLTTLLPHTYYWSPSDQECFAWSCAAAHTTSSPPKPHVELEATTLCMLRRSESVVPNPAGLPASTSSRT